MSFIILFVRFTLALLSIVGYSLLFHKKLKIEAYAAPLFSISIITLTIYVLGLLGCLKYSAYGIAALGLALVILEARHFTRRDIINLKVINGGNLIAVFVFVYFTNSLLHMHLMHYDNFSHWAIVAKEMLLKDAIPTSESVLIDFKNYPLATTAWIYYIGKLIGPQEGSMLTAQFLIVYSCFLCMFRVIRDRKRFLLDAILWVTLGLMFIFNISIRLDNLLVDFVLPMMALAVVGIIQGTGKNIPKCCLTIAPVLAMMVLVKNNASFFFAVCLVFLCWKAAWSEAKKKAFVCAALCALLGVSFYMSWNLHTNRVFKGEEHKFQISSEITAAENAKTEEEHHVVVKEFKAQVFTRRNMNTVGFLMLNVLGFGAWLTGVRITKRKWHLYSVLVIGDLLCVLYYIGILWMYLFLMPMSEASYLAGFERYTSSILIFFLGVLGMTLVIDVENSLHVQQGEMRDIYGFQSLTTKSIYMNTCMALAMAAVLLVVSEVNGMRFMNDKYVESLPGKVNYALRNHDVPDNDPGYAIYATDNDSQVSNNYLGYVARYLLLTKNLYTFSDFNDPEIAENLENYDYLVLVEVDENALQHLSTYIPGEIEPGVYRIHEQFQEE